jgi:hypothetical protein
MPEPVSDDTARTRWMVIILARLTGVAMVIIGLLIVQRGIEGPEVLGYAFVLAGLAGTFVVPIKLARRWRSPDA